MSIGLLQFNSGEHVFAGKNLAEAVVTDDDIVFSESYIVTGNELVARVIYATYDLTVLGSVSAKKITTNGDLHVIGNIIADEIICHGNLLCTGEVRAKKLSVDNSTVAESITSDEVQTSGNIFSQLTIDTDSVLETNGLVVAGEGIMGDGSFSAKAAIANEYFEFNGVKNSSVFEISSMEFSQVDQPAAVQPAASPDTYDIADAIDIFTRSLSESLDEWSLEEEERFIEEVKQTTLLIPDLHAVDTIIDKIVALSYEREIDNFRDYLYVLLARETFPEALVKYETIEPVLNDMFHRATPRIGSMRYSAKNIEEFASSLYILHKYADILPIDEKIAADKVFSSVGLRFSTVEHAWRRYNNE